MSWTVDGIMGIIIEIMENKTQQKKETCQQTRNVNKWLFAVCLRVDNIMWIIALIISAYLSSTDWKSRTCVMLFIVIEASIITELLSKIAITF